MVMVLQACAAFFFNRRILLHGKNSQKRDNIKRKITKQQTT